MTTTTTTAATMLMLMIMTLFGGTMKLMSHGKSITVRSSGNLARPLSVIIKEKSHVSLQNVLGILALVRTCHLFLEELDDVFQDFFRESHWAKQPRPIKFLP